MAKNPISLQMYTVRDDAARDPIATIEAVAAAGYRAMELAGTMGLSAAELRRRLDALGVVVSGAHVAIDRLEGQIESVIDEMRTLGGKYVICPFLPPQRRGDIAAYRALVPTLNAIGGRCHEAGLTFVYHNHDFELHQAGGTTGLHTFLRETDPALVQFELDVYWAVYAGFDPGALLAEFAGRVPLVHLKNMTPEPNRTFAEVGHGTLDIPAICAAADAAGAEWFIVEQDRCERPALESVAMSINYLKSIGRA
ncbi:MAG TPA: sugar phosphate isomerase/epimerase [Roseiflexaceae bacterium]|nr:sugar phosphate isomerase/epimerase [Roseiflexaceae bacterium]